MQHPVFLGLGVKMMEESSAIQEKTGWRFLSDKMTIKPVMKNGASRKNQ